MEKERFVKAGTEGGGYTVKGDKVFAKSHGSYGWRNKSEYQEIYVGRFFGGLVEKKGLTQYVKNMRKSGYKVSIKKIK